jgi:tRNA(Ile)-lysidine synthase
MKLEIKPGKYILAVSGGVDSMVLLDMLSKRLDLELIVAHFNHGIRQEAGEDEKMVRDTAGQFNLPFEIGRVNLGSNASEEAARKARYNFLFDIQKKHEAQAIITAHHQDDLIETALINLLRGTGRKGLTAIQDNKKVLRPLLKYSKEDILKYARANKLIWHEDRTNSDKTYLRNYIRRHLIKELSGKQRLEILKNIDKVAKFNVDIDSNIAKLSQYIYKDDYINRYDFNKLPISLGNELMAFWLRHLQIQSFDKKTIERLSIALKTARPDTICPVQGDIKLLIGQKTANFSSTL